MKRTVSPRLFAAPPLSGLNDLAIPRLADRTDELAKDNIFQL
jgi:hypothetical protein